MLWFLTEWLQERKHKAHSYVLGKVQLGTSEGADDTAWQQTVAYFQGPKVTLRTKKGGHTCHFKWNLGGFWMEEQMWLRGFSRCWAGVTYGGHNVILWETSQESGFCYTNKKNFHKGKGFSCWSQNHGPKDSNCRHDCTGLSEWNMRIHWHPGNPGRERGGGISCPEQEKSFRTSQALADYSLHLHWSLALGRVHFTHHCPGLFNPLLVSGTPCYWP